MESSAKWRVLQEEPSKAESLEKPIEDESSKKPNKMENEQYHRFLLLLATLVATITYQAGLNPPEGFRKSVLESGQNETLPYRRTSAGCRQWRTQGGLLGAAHLPSSASRPPSFSPSSLSNLHGAPAGKRGSSSPAGSARGCRSFIVFAGLTLLAGNTAVAQGASDNHGNTHPPSGPPPWTSMAQEFYSFSQQQLLEQSLYGFPRDVFTEDMIKALRKIEEGKKMIEEGAKDFHQNFMGRYYCKQNQYGDHHPRLETAGPSGQAHNIDDERPGQSHKLKLRFHGSLKSRIYTNKPLLAQSNGGIEISICRDDQIITSGHLASLRVEIVALESDHSCKDDWTEEDFDRQIRKSRDGQESVLEGERFVELVNGKGSLGNIRFKERSTGMRSREFVLAAKVCRSEDIGGTRVEEAFMHPPFMVLVERSKVNEKSCIPKLDDKVHSLKGIARDGPYAKRLEKENIFTVHDFLKELNKDSDKLRQILEMKSQASWDAMVTHARECDLRDSHELKSHKVETENVSLFFNCVDDLIGAEFCGRFVAKDKFEAAQKALVDRQLKQAYSKLDGIEFGYVMEGDHPIKMSTNINAAGSTSIPTLLGASSKNAPGHQATFKAAENLSPGSGIHFAPGLPLQDANLNAAWHNASEPSWPDLRNGHVNQGSEPTTDDPGFCPCIDRAPVEPLGDANCNAAGQSALEPYRPVHCNRHVNQGLGGNCFPHPEGETIWLNTASVNVAHTDIMDEIWKSVDESQRATTAAPVMPTSSPQAHGSEPTDDKLCVWLQSDIASSDPPDETFYGTTFICYLYEQLYIFCVMNRCNSEL